MVQSLYFITELPTFFITHVLALRGKPCVTGALNDYTHNIFNSWNDQHVASDSSVPVGMGSIYIFQRSHDFFVFV